LTEPKPLVQNHNLPHHNTQNNQQTHLGINSLGTKSSTKEMPDFKTNLGQTKRNLPSKPSFQHAYAIQTTSLNGQNHQKPSNVNPNPLD
jgi:hypothetical protein